jgi:hypothetical protein
MSDIENEVAQLLSRTVDEAAGWLSTAETELESRFGSQISAWKEALSFEYGCWCGPGHRCEDPVDAMDSCCKTHDLAYDGVGLDFGSMWTPAAIVKAQSADQALYDCVSASPEPEEEEARAYRAVLLAAFKGRLEIASFLKSL